MKPFSIEKNKTIPPIESKSIKYPFAEMDINDSFFVEVKDGEDLHLVRKRLLSSASSYVMRDFFENKTLKRKYITRFVDGGIRCWRIK